MKAHHLSFLVLVLVLFLFTACDDGQSIAFDTDGDDAEAGEDADGDNEMNGEISDGEVSDDGPGPEPAVQPSAL